MEPPHLPDNPVPGPQVQVVCVGQLHLAANVLQILGAEGSFDGPLGPYIHKHRGLDRAMGAGEHTPAGASFGFNQLKHIIPPTMGRPWPCARRGNPENHPSTETVAAHFDSHRQ